jgi:hypothetical protein
MYMSLYENPLSLFFLGCSHMVPNISSLFVSDLSCVVQCFWTTDHDPVDRIRCRIWDQRHWILSLQASTTMHNKQLQLNKEAVGWVVDDEDWGLKCRSRRSNADTFGKPGMAWSRAQASNICTLKEGPSHESTLSPRKSCTVVVPSLLFCTHLCIRKSVGRSQSS